MTTAVPPLSTTVAVIGAAFDWRALAVARRNGLVYLRNWRTAFLPPAMEPIVYFLALGLGLSGYVGELRYGDETIDYPTYVAAGLLAFTAFGTPFYEALYSSYVRMFYQKTWDGILATQVELPHIVWGEALWAGARGAMNTSIVCVVLAGFDAFGAIDVHAATLVVFPAVAFVFGVAIGTFALFFTAIVPSIDHMNYPVFLVGLPASFASNTYFPLEVESELGRSLLALNPIMHFAETARSLLVFGRLDGAHAVGLAATIAGLLLFGVLVVQPKMRRRVLGG